MRNSFPFLTEDPSDDPTSSLTNRTDTGLWSWSFCSAAPELQHSPWAQQYHHMAEAKSFFCGCHALFWLTEKSPLAPSPLQSSWISQCAVAVCVYQELLPTQLLQSEIALISTVIFTVLNEPKDSQQRGTDFVIWRVMLPLQAKENWNHQLS